MKCNICKEDTEYRLCDTCFEDLDRFESSLSRMKFRIFWRLRTEDQVLIYLKCLWKPRKKQLKIVRNMANWFNYIWKRKDWKEYHIHY
jgi:hypothetical protein